jgi:CheY-like chemotaxis protein
MPYSGLQQLWGNAMQVLYVDDEEPNRRVIGRMLDKAGIQMAEAKDADTGLWMIAAKNYDVVLMDVRMPGKDGLSAIVEIRAHEDGKQHVPIIVLTADDAYDVRVRAKAVGADDILIKPVTKDQLLGAIKGVLVSRRASKAA